MFNFLALPLSPSVQHLQPTSRVVFHISHTQKLAAEPLPQKN